jgi:hypothetical protein
MYARINLRPLRANFAVFSCFLVFLLAFFLKMHNYMFSFFKFSYT